MTFADLVRLLEDAHPNLTVFVEPHRVAEIRAAVDAADLPARVTVLGSPLVPAGQMLVANETLLHRGMERGLEAPLHFEVERR